MPLPDFLAKPIFSALYPAVRKRMGSPVPPIKRSVTPFDPTRQQAFDNLIDTSLANGKNSLIEYTLPYPKADFLTYLCDWREFVAHGSPDHSLHTLEPIRKSTDIGEFGNRQQIFCSPDALWAMWFAILDKSRYRQTRNGCVRVGSDHKRIKFYHFELPADLQTDPPLVNGTIYLARPSDFPHKRVEKTLAFFNAEAEEWGSMASIIPLARLPLTPQDFPYLDHIQYCL